MRPTVQILLALASTTIALGRASAGPPPRLLDGPLLTASAPAAARVQAVVGWSTTTDEAVADIRTEARVWRGLSLFAGAHARRDGDGGRPVLGGAYQLRDGRDGTAVRAQVMYRPEGMTEPEGEVEASVIGARGVADGWLAGALTYGQDSEGRERDVEALLGYRRGLGRHTSAGVVTRGRRALGVQLEQDRVWDALAAGVVAVRVGEWSVELLSGVEQVGRTGRGQTGAVTTFGVGRDLVSRAWPGADVGDLDAATVRPGREVTVAGPRCYRPRVPRRSSMHKPLPRLTQPLVRDRLADGTRGRCAPPRGMRPWTAPPLASRLRSPRTARAASASSAARRRPTR